MKDVSFTVEKGTIFGLLGPNGAGKTTLMQMISTLLMPTTGIISICGLDTQASAQEIRKRIGFLTTEIKLDPLSTPNQLYSFFSELYDIPKEEVEARKQASFARLKRRNVPTLCRYSERTRTTWARRLIFWGNTGPIS